MKLVVLRCLHNNPWGSYCAKPPSGLTGQPPGALHLKYPKRVIKSAGFGFALLLGLESTSRPRQYARHLLSSKSVERALHCWARVSVISYREILKISEGLM